MKTAKRYIVVDDRSNMLVPDGIYTSAGINKYLDELEERGYTIVRHMAGNPHIIVMRECRAQLKRKKDLTEYILTLDKNEKWLILSFLTRHIKPIEIGAIWRNVYTRNAYIQLEEIRKHEFDFEDEIIVMLRKELKGVDVL